MRYLKVKLLLFTLSLIPFVLSAQVWQQNNIEYGFQYKGIKTIRALLIPTIQTSAGQGRDTGAIYYRLADSSIYVWTGSQWRQVTGSGGGAADSSVFATRYFVGQNYVPYTGAIGNVNLGEYQLSAGQVTFDQTPTGTAGVGVLRWNDTDGTLEFGMKGGNVTQQIGQELPTMVKNSSGSLIPNGSVVYLSGSDGTNATVALARADAEITSKTVLGVATEDIANGAKGLITIFGRVRDINTSALTEGQPVYLSSSVAGGLTSTAPTGDTYPIVVGFVERSHASNGVLFVHSDREFVRQYILDTTRNGIRADLNGKQGALTLTTTGSSGAATLVGNTLNIPQYSGGGGGSNDTIFGTPYTKVGFLINDNFAGVSLGANWSDVTPTATVTVNNKVTMTGGSTNFADYIQNSVYNMFELMDYKIRVIPTVKDASSFGVGLGLEGVNSVSALNYRLYVSLDLTNASTSGTIKLWNTSSNSFYTHPAKFSFSANDTLQLTVKRRYNYFIIRVDNFTTDKFIDFTYKYPTVGWSYVIPPVNRIRLFNLGGTNDFLVASTYSHNRAGGVVWIGNSISTGYASTDNDKRGSALSFLNDPSKFTVVAGAGAVSADVAAYATQLSTYGYSQAVVNIGVNDAGQFVSTSTYKANVDSIRARLARGGATVHLMNLVPGNSTDMTNYNTQLSDLATTYSLKYIDIFSRLKQSGNTRPQANYTYDGVHLTDSGYIVQRNELLTTAPEVQNELLADTIAPAFIQAPTINEDEVIGVLVKDALNGIRTIYKKIAYKSDVVPYANGVGYATAFTVGQEYRAKNGFMAFYPTVGTGNYQVLKIDTSSETGSVKFKFTTYDNADPTTLNGGNGIDFRGAGFSFFSTTNTKYIGMTEAGVAASKVHIGTATPNSGFSGNQISMSGADLALLVNGSTAKIQMYHGISLGAQFDQWSIIFPNWNGAATFNTEGAIQWYNTTKQFRAYRNAKTLHMTLEGNATVTYSATTNIDMNVENHQTVNLTGDVTFTTSNRVAGRDVMVRVVADGSTRNLTFPSWKWVGSAAPASIASGKTGLLILRSFGANDTDIVATWEVEL